MKRFWGIFILPLIWMALTGDFSAGNFLLGFVISSLALWISHPGGESVPLIFYLKKIILWTKFLGFFLVELILASLRVAYDVLTPRHHMRPAVLGIPLDLEGDLEITFFANIITLTPGTLSLDVSSDRKTLYIHAMYIDDVQQFKKNLKNRLERRIMELLR
ncbi:MAG: multicomponent Na+:H+ antiporter subunit [Desulfuromonadales bacterium]|jgi:multicomponent Na+:H+ antiporter subunit E|nr:multicomponent Na+:H+ antiporter subunit [Desulfuromonadales bacterium]